MLAANVANVSRHETAFYIGERFRPHCCCGVLFVNSKCSLAYSLQRGTGAPVHIPGVQSCVRAQADREVHR